MKQTIEIEVPDGKKAIWTDGKVIFQDINPQLPKTLEEFCEMKNFDKSEAYIDFNSHCVEVNLLDDETRCYHDDRNILPSKQAAEAHLVLMQLHQLRDYYRQGWVPDYTDTSDKFCINHYFSYYLHECNYEIVVRTTNSYFLSFQSKEIAEKFLNTFRDLIEKAGDLI